MPATQRAKRKMIAAGAALLLAMLVFAVLYALLPGLLLERYRREVADLGDYHGRAERVDVSLAGLRYRLHGVRIERRDGAPDQPLLQAEVETRLYPLQRRSEVHVHALQLHLHDAGVAGRSQLGEGVPWRHLLDALAPSMLPVSRVELRDASLSVTTPRAPHAPIRIDQLHATLSGLTDATDARHPMPASIQAEARALAHAPLSLRVHFDPSGPMRRMQMQLQVAPIELSRLDPWADAWGGIDFERGVARAQLQLGSIGAQVDGGLQLTLDDVDVFDARRDLRGDGDGVLRAARELLFGAGAALATSRGGPLEIERDVAAEIALPQDNLDGLRAALVAGLQALDAR